MARRCRPCETGLGPGQIKTYDPDCAGCFEKRAKGQRTGYEPHPRELKSKALRKALGGTWSENQAKQRKAVRT